MPSICCVAQCENRGGVHKFPRDKALRNKWIIAIKCDKWKPGKSHVVCYKHFCTSDYNDTTGIGKLYCLILIVFVTQYMTYLIYASLSLPNFLITAIYFR